MAPAPEQPVDHLVVIDVGNTHTVLGVFRGEELVHAFRLSTARQRTADEYAALLLPLFHRAGLDPSSTTGVVLSSVVPPLVPAFRRLSTDIFGCEALVVEPGIRTGISLRHEHPAEVGADRIVNALAARELFGSPSIVVDFGTAVTFDVINAQGEYVGGIIAPGLGLSAEALFAHASRLSRIDVRKPPRLVGGTTVVALQSGLYYGFASLVDGLVERLVAEIGTPKAVVATGGEAGLIAEESRYISDVHPTLTLVGLRLLYELNRRP
jgi:type III pantothenate kinase